MQIISRRERIESVSYTLSWAWRDAPGAGFGFPCDEHGTLDEASLNSCALANLRACRDGSYAVDGPVVVSTRWSYMQPAVGLCSCGQEVQLDRFTNPCDCGADYNGSGSLLTPRECWGEETGEHWTECV